MEIKYLQEFIVLANAGNFTEAAELLFISQSTLSKHIKSIEQELGVELFDRTTRSVSISEFGELLLPYANEILELHNQYNTALEKKLPTNRETLTVGSIRSLAQYNITDILARFKKVRPQSTVKMIHSIHDGMPLGIRKLKEFLRQKKCDLAFLRIYEKGDDDLIKIPYVNDSLVAVIPSSHPLARQKSIPLKLLKNMGFLLIEESSYLYQLCVRACQENGFEPNIVYTDPKPENLIGLVKKEMGIALLMKQLASYFVDEDIAIVELTPTIHSKVCLCHLKDKELSEAAKQFIDCTNQQIELNKFLFD